LARFRECVEDLIAYRGIDNRDVQRAVAIVEDRYTDPRLTQAAVADEVGLLPDELSMRFRRHMSLTFTEYLREVRLDRAATLLATTERRITEIWAEVGYNDASNFDHQFKARFGAHRASSGFVRWLANRLLGGRGQSCVQLRPKAQAYSSSKTINRAQR
jgi:AraC-like DNA-binding protein